MVHAVACLLILAASINARAATRPVPCPANRWVATEGGDRIAGTSGGPVILPIAYPQVAVSGGCVPARTRMRVTRRGTRIVVSWPTCGTFRQLRLRATLALSCDQITGTLRARRQPQTSFVAKPSRCGDTVIDTGAGEQCDGITCAADQPCTSCACGGTAGVCTTRVVPLEGASHVAVGTTISWASNPPASGPHYPVWARYQLHTQTVPRGYWVHNLEHGAVVVLHQPTASADLIDALHTAYQALPNDPACGHPRALLTIDALISSPIAVVAWGIAMECMAVDPQAIADFVDGHRGKGPEGVCANGSYP